MSPKETTAATLPDELDERRKPEEETEPTPVVESDGDVIVDIDDDRATDQTKPDSREPEPAPEDKAPEGTDPDSDQTPPKMDSDHDGLSDELELMVGTNLLEADTDGDGLTDGFEYFSQAGLDPKLADTDGDESKDGEELLFKTDPTNVDTDGDGLQDGRDLLPTDATNTLGIPQGATSTDPETEPTPESSSDYGPDSGPVTSPSQVDDTLSQPVDPYDSNSIDSSASDSSYASDDSGYGSDSYEDVPSDDMAMEYDG